MTERKRGKPTRVNAVLDSVLVARGIAGRVEQAAIISEWPRLVGRQIAEVTEPLSITAQGTLFVAVKTNAWMSELSLMEPQLLKALNAATGRRPIRKIRWQIQRG